jgi:hypothetical protein
MTADYWNIVWERARITGFWLAGQALVHHHGKLAGEGTFTWHRSSHRQAMDMEVGASERGRQTTYSIRTLYFSKVILGTSGGRMCTNRPKFEVSQPRNHP